MSPAVSVGLAVALIGAIFLFGSREVASYRKNQRNRAEVYPYTGARLVRRLLVTACLIAEVVLLLLVRFTLTPTRPFWFLMYVGAVLGLVIAMIVLSLLDFRETFRQGSRSLDQLNSEFLCEIGRGENQPETH